MKNKFMKKSVSLALVLSVMVSVCSMSLVNINSYSETPEIAEVSGILAYENTREEINYTLAVGDNILISKYSGVEVDFGS